jgi:K+-sensing histidine kinase KdpD
VSNLRFVLQCYGLPVLSVDAALGPANLAYNLNLRGVEFPMLLLAGTVWYAPRWLGIVDLVLATLGFNYYFTHPRFSFYVTLADIPYDVVCILLGLLIIWFSAHRHGVRLNLPQSRDELRREVAIRTQQASTGAEVWTAGQVGGGTCFIFSLLKP